MKLKKISSLCIVAAIISSCFNLAFAVDGVSVISVGKPIRSIYYDDGGRDYPSSTRPPSNANDGNIGTVYYSNAGTGNKDGLIIDLSGDFKVSYAEVVFTGGTPVHSIFVSKTADFSADVYELTLQDGKLAPSVAVKDDTFRYVKLDVSENTNSFRVKEFTVYGIASSDDEPQVPAETTGTKTLPLFENKKVEVSLNKKAVAKMYNEGGYYSSYSQMTHSANLAVDGITGNSNDNAFISAYVDEDWLRVDLGKEVKIADVVITAYPQYNGAKVDNVSDWYVVMASNSDCAYNEEFPEYVVLEGGFTDTVGIFHLPEEYENQKFRYFQIVKPKKEGVLDAMVVREFTVNAYAKDLYNIASLNKPVIRNGVIYYNDALTDGNTSTKANYENAVIDLLTPSYIKDIVAKGDNTGGIAYYGGVENADVSAMKLISEYPDEQYRYIYVDNSGGANISEIEVSTYFSDILSVWNYNEEDNTYSLNVTNGDSTSERVYTAIVSQIDADGKVLKTYSQKLELSSGSEGKFEIETGYAYGVDRVVCNVFREDIVALTNPMVFIAGENKTQTVTSDGVIAVDKSLTDVVVRESINNGIKIKAKSVANIESTDVYSIIIYNPSGEIVGYMSENAKNTDTVYEYVAAATAPEGSYKATICLTDPNLKSYYKELEFDNVYPTAEETADCITQFKATDGSNFAALYEQFYTQKRVIDFGELSFIDSQNVFNRIGPAYAWARDNISKWSDKTIVETVDDILSCFKVALIFDAAMYNDISLLDAMKLYSKEMSKIIIEDYAAITELYTRKYTDTEYDKVLQNLITCNALSSIKGKAVTDIVKNIQTYSTELGIDTTKLINDGIDLFEIAKRLNNTIPDSYYDGLSTEVASIVADLPSGGNDEGIVGDDVGNNDTNGGGGGSSGGGGDNTSVPYEDLFGDKSEQKEEIIINTKKFNDVSDNYWARSYIEKLAQEGIINGVTDEVFEPERPITRAEFVKIVVSAFKISTKPDGKVIFKDCDIDDWFYPYVEAGASNKIISGVSVEEFRPQNNIMRQDAAVILDNVMLYLGVASYEAGKVSFTDASEISPYAERAVNLLTSCKIITGMDDGRFAPKGALTRAEAATLIVKFLEFIGGEIS